MPDIIDISTYQQVQNVVETPTQYGTYGNLAQAIDANTGWRVIEGGKTAIEAAAEPGVTPSNVYPIAQQFKNAADLEGGVVGYNEMVNVEAAAGGGVTAASSGIFAGWTLGTAVIGVLAGAGVGIAAFELAPEFWTGLSNRIFGTDIAYEDIKDYTIIGRIQKETVGQSSKLTTYLPQNIVQTILNYAAEYGLFSGGQQANYNHEYEQSGTYNCTFGDIGKCIQDCVTKFASLNPAMLENVAFQRLQTMLGAFIEFVENEVGTRNAIGVSLNFGYAGLEIRSFTLAVNASEVIEPVSTTISSVGTSFNLPYIQTNHGTFPNTHQYVLHSDVSEGSQYNYWEDTGSTGETQGFIGYNCTQFDVRYPISVKTTNFDRDYETTYPPYVYPLPGAEVYNPLHTLPQQYPDWTNRAQQTNGLKLPYDDPSLYPIPWLPVAMPDADPMVNPQAYPQPGTQPAPEPATQPKAQEGTMPQTLPEPYQNPKNIPETAKDPKTGSPDPVPQDQPTDPTPTPVITFPTVGGEANAIFTVYNPTLAQLNSLAGVLWSSNFLDNLIKIFTNNPMDAIISLHMLYATPTTGSNKEIVLGCYPTGVSALEVTKQYLEINCGTVRIPEYFGDARDYVNTVVDIYLPFVGMRHLKTQDIVGSYVTVKACVDVFTGTILYTINIRKSSGINQVMYAMEGNCAVQLPLTGADKSRMFSVLGAAATGAAVGGVAGAVGGAALSAMNGSAQTDIQRSGNFGSNAGAMGVKKPYIVVSRNIGYDSANYNKYHGFPTNITVSLGSCTGFTRILDCHLTGIDGATDTELKEIESLLKEGVII